MQLHSCFAMHSDGSTAWSLALLLCARPGSLSTAPCRLETSYRTLQQQAQRSAAKAAEMKDLVPQLSASASGQIPAHAALSAGTLLPGDLAWQAGAGQHVSPLSPAAAALPGPARQRPTICGGDIDLANHPPMLLDGATAPQLGSAGRPQQLAACSDNRPSMQAAGCGVLNHQADGGLSCLPTPPLRKSAGRAAAADSPCALTPASRLPADAAPIASTEEGQIGFGSLACPPGVSRVCGSSRFALPDTTAAAPNTGAEWAGRDGVSTLGTQPGCPSLPGSISAPLAAAATASTAAGCASARTTADAAHRARTGSAAAMATAAGAGTARKLGTLAAAAGRHRPNSAGNMARAAGQFTPSSTGTSAGVGGRLKPSGWGTNADVAGRAGAHQSGSPLELPRTPAAGISELQRELQAAQQCAQDVAGACSADSPMHAFVHGMQVSCFGRHS